MRERRLRVAITARAVSPWHGRGGLERHVADLVHHLSRAAVDVTLITAKPARDPEPLVVSPHGRVQVIPVSYLTFPLAGRRGTTILDRDTAYPLFGWRAGRVAARLAGAGEIDLVHGLGASVLGFALGRGEGTTAVPLVFNPQGLEEFGATDPARAGLKVAAYWPLQRAVRACAARADAILATDEALVPVVRRHLAVEPSRVHVVPNAVDLDRCDGLAGPAEGSRLRAAHALPSTATVLLTAGRLEQNKGFHVLADAIAQAAARGRDLHWVIVGDGPFRSRLLERIERAGVGSRIMSRGAVDDRELHAWYEAADLFVHPTLYEGSSLVTLEAMAHRRPVIATRAGGLPDKVKPGVNGWLVPPGDAAALAGALDAACDARGEWPAFGAAGRVLVERLFAWPAVTARLISVYERLLSVPSARSGS